MLSLEGFQSPSPIHRGTELWMLNAQLQPEELRRQIREMKRQGFYSYCPDLYRAVIRLPEGFYEQHEGNS